MKPSVTANMPRIFSSQCDLSCPGDTATIYAPGRIFDSTKIPRDGPTVLQDPPLKAARFVIRKGLSALNSKNSRAVKLWKRLTGHDEWRFTKLPTMSVEDCCIMKNLIYLIFDTERHRITYVGQTTQTLEKRISDHIRKMKFLQNYGSFDNKSHKSLIAYRMAVNGIQHIHVLPWFHFGNLIKPSWPIPGTADFRKLIERRYEFPIAESLHCF